MSASEPLTLRHLRILLILADGPLHGYAISSAIERDSAGAVSLRPGSLYRALHQLAGRRLIEEVEADDGDPRRRSYRLTRAGRRALAGEMEQLDGMVDHARRLGVLDGGR